MLVQVLGEAVVDLVPEPRVGGSPLNVATGLARAGLTVRFGTGLGEDPYGDLVRAQLATEGVALEAVRTTRTNTARVRLVDGEATYDLEVHADLPRPDLTGVDALHVGSLAAVLEPGASVVAATVRAAVAADVFVSYDPNLRPGLMDGRTAGRVRALAAACDLVKLSEADALLLAPEDDPDMTAQGLLAGRTGLVVLTRGARGATAFTATGREDRAADPVTVVDTIGAGDAFTAGLLSARFGGSRPADRTTTAEQPTTAEQLSAAAASAALSCSRSGA